MLWFFIILVVLTFALNRLSMKWGLKGVSYKRDLSKNMIEIGETFEIITTIENRKPLPVAFLKITEKLPLILEHRGIPNYEKVGEDFQFTTTLFTNVIYHVVKSICHTVGIK